MELQFKDKYCFLIEENLYICTSNFWDVEAAGSNPATPTFKAQLLLGFFVFKILFFNMINTK